MLSTSAFVSLSINLGIMLYMMPDVECTWAWEWDRDNTFSPMSRYARSRVPHVGVRRSIFEKFWGDSTPNNPFLNNHPSSLRLRPRINENEFLLADDYEDDITDSHWLPQTRRHHTSQHPKSLEGLEHILEGKLGPVNDSPPMGHRKEPSVLPAHKDEIEKKQKGKQRKHQQRLRSHEVPPSSDQGSSSHTSTEPESPHRLSAFPHESHLLNNGQFSKDALRDFQEPFSMSEHFTNPKQFPEDFITHDQFPSEIEIGEPLTQDHLTTDPFAIQLEGQQPFQEHLLLSPLPDHDFGSPDHIINLDADHTLSEVDLPQIFPNLGILGKIGHPESFMPQERLGPFGLPDANSSPDILPEDGEGLEWLPPGLSELNLPSHGHMISALEDQTMSKEAHRDACHARNLHSCGSRLIDEFAFGPDNPDKCRIRKEFLDCMEQVMKLPCELHGERYSREGTKLIRDKIKTLLWSVQGCILGYST